MSEISAALELFDIPFAARKLERLSGGSGGTCAMSRPRVLIIDDEAEATSGCCGKSSEEYNLFFAKGGGWPP